MTPPGCGPTSAKRHVSQSRGGDEGVRGPRERRQRADLNARRYRQPPLAGAQAKGGLSATRLPGTGALALHGRPPGQPGIPRFPVQSLGMQQAGDDRCGNAYRDQALPPALCNGLPWTPCASCPRPPMTQTRLLCGQTLSGIRVSDHPDKREPLRYRGRSRSHMLGSQAWRLACRSWNGSIGELPAAYLLSQSIINHKLDGPR